MGKKTTNWSPDMIDRKTLIKALTAKCKEMDAVEGVKLAAPYKKELHMLLDSLDVEDDLRKEYHTRITNI